MGKKANPLVVAADAIAFVMAAPLWSAASPDVFPSAADHMLGDARWLLRDIPRGGFFF